jgi:hypothetical protein
MPKMSRRRNRGTLSRQYGSDPLSWVRSAGRGISSMVGGLGYGLGRVAGGLGYGVRGLGRSLGYGVRGLGYGVRGLGSGLGYGVRGLGYGVRGVGRAAALPFRVTHRALTAINNAADRACSPIPSRAGRLACKTLVQHGLARGSSLAQLGAGYNTVRNVYNYARGY